MGLLRGSNRKTTPALRCRRRRRERKDEPERAGELTRVLLTEQTRATWIWGKSRLGGEGGHKNKEGMGASTPQKEACGLWVVEKVGLKGCVTRLAQVSESHVLVTGARERH